MWSSTTTIWSCRSRRRGRRRPPTPRRRPTSFSSSFLVLLLVLGLFISNGQAGVGVEEMQAGGIDGDCHLSLLLDLAARTEPGHQGGLALPGEHGVAGLLGQFDYVRVALH